MTQFLQFTHKYRNIFAALSLTFLVIFMAGCAAPSFLTDLEAIIPVALSAITGILGIIGGATGDPALVAAGNEIQGIATKVAGELTIIEQLIADYKTTPNESKLEEIEAEVNAAITDLKTILTTAGLPTSMATTVSNVVNAVVTQLEALLSVIPLFKSSTAGTSLAVNKPVSASEFKAKIHSALTVPVAPAAGA